MKKLTETQIKAWKKTHGEIYKIDVEIDDKGTKAACYVKKPDLKILSAASKFSDDPIKSGNMVLTNCWIDGDERIKDNDEARLSAINLTNNLFKIRLATIKKL